MSNESDALLNLAENEFLDVTRANLKTDDNLESIHAQWNTRMDKHLGKGQLSIREQRRLTRDALWMQINQRAGQRSRNYLAEMVKGQLTLFQIEELLDRVIKAGKTRRTTYRDLTDADRQRMYDEREKNFKKQDHAWTEYKDEIDPALKGWLSEHGSMPKAMKEGAIPFVHDENESEPDDDEDDEE